MRKVELKVLSAKVVNTNFSNNKKTLNSNGKLEESINDIDNPIHINHIINMLHVMFGCRPVSWKRGNHKRLSPKIINIAENGIIRYDNAFKREIKNKNGEVETIFYNEFVQGKRNAIDSNRKSIYTIASNGEVYNFVFTWSYLKKRMYSSPQYKDVYDIIMNFANKYGYLNVEKEYKLIDFFILLRDKYSDFAKQFDNIQNIAPIFYILNKDSGNASFNSIKSQNLAGLCNMVTPTRMISINATIILFMEDEDADNLLKGKRFANILDGGHVYILGNHDKKIIETIADFNIVDNVEEYINECTDCGFIRIKNLPYTKKNNV